MPQEDLRFSFKPLAVLLAILVGWVALVVVLRTLLPVSNAMRGALYFGVLRNCGDRRGAVHKEGAVKGRLT